MLHFHDAVESTMELAHRLAASGAPSGDAVVARQQRAGRGQQGRVWSAEPGGLWLSVIGHPDATQGLDPLSLRVGLAVAQTIEQEVSGVMGIRLKWPNDLMLNGRKLGGVLSEARWQGDRCLWVVTGVGINLHNPIPSHLAEVAIALHEVTDAPMPEALAPALAAAIAAALRGGALTELELAEWDLRDALRGRTLRTPVAGSAEGITPQGSLLVRTPTGGQVTCALGVVALTD